MYTLALEWLSRAQLTQNVPFLDVRLSLVGVFLRLAGLSESSLVSYVISLAKRARDIGSLAAQLQGQGLPATGATHAFAAALLTRVARPAAAPSAYKQQEQAAMAAARKNRCAPVCLPSYAWTCLCPGGRCVH